MRFELSVEGLDELQKKLKAATEDVQEGVYQGIQETVLRMEADAKDNCPVGITGDLRGSITARVKREGNATVGEVGTNNEIAAYVEFGTGPKGRDTAVPNKYPGPIRYKQEKWKGKIPGVGWRWISGMAARPYMYPALVANKDKMPKLIARAIEKNMGRG